MGLKIRQVINVLIDAPDKDKPFIVECRKDELDKCKYEYGQLEISKLTNCGNSSVADAYVRPEDKWWKDKGECRMTYEEKSGIVIEQLRADRDRLLDVFEKIRAEIKEKIEQEEFARSVFRHEEKDTFKAEQCTGSIMAYNNVIKLIDKYKAESEDKE